MNSPKERFFPRPYQEACLRKLRRTRISGKSKALVVMASGLGKTVVSAFDVRRWLKKNKGRILYLCHQKDILTQARETFEKILGPSYSYGYFHGDEKTESETDVVFASFQTMKDYRYNFTKRYFAYIIVDEGHHSPAETYRPTIKYFQSKFLLGLTATPDRADLKDIRHIFGKEVFSLTLEEALIRGLLTNVDYRLLTDDIQNLKALETPIGQLTISQLNRTLFVPRRDQEIIRIIQERTAGVDNPRIAIFCPSISYCNRLAEMIPNSTSLHSKMSRDLYSDRMTRVRGGSISTFLTVDKFNEGIDLPEVNVIVFLRSTLSKTIFLQQLGRGLRKFPGKDFVLVLDFVGNCERLEMLYNIWNSLNKQPRGSRDESEETSITIEMGTLGFTETALEVIKVLNSIKLGHTRETLINYLKDLGKTLGRTPRKVDIQSFSKRKLGPSERLFTKHFGSTNRALAAAGFELNLMWGYDKKDLLLALQDLAKRLGHTPTLREVKNASKSGLCPTANTYYYRFGGLNAALEEAGLKQNRYVGYTKKYVKKQVRDLAAKLRRKPTRDDLKKACANHQIASISTIFKLFVTWNNFVSEVEKWRF